MLHQCFKLLKNCYKIVYLRKRDDGDDGDDFSGVSGEKDQRSGQRTAVCHEGPEEGHAER